MIHYGIPGMKWGVRRSVYKSMDRTQRRQQRKNYYHTPEGKIKKATTIGTLVGGPIVGVIAGSIASKKVNNLSKDKISKGKNAVEKSKNKKINTAKNIDKRSKNETDEQKITRLINEGKAGGKANYIFDQDGKLFMVTWDD